MYKYRNINKNIKQKPVTGFQQTNRMYNKAFTT